MKKHALVSGGAGYMGSQAFKALKECRYVPVTVDILSNGW